MTSTDTVAVEIVSSEGQLKKTFQIRSSPVLARSPHLSRLLEKDHALRIEGSHQEAEHQPIMQLISSSGLRQSRSSKVARKSADPVTGICDPCPEDSSAREVAFQQMNHFQSPVAVREARVGVFIEHRNCSFNKSFLWSRVVAGYARITMRQLLILLAIDGRIGRCPTLWRYVGPGSVLVIASIACSSSVCEGTLLVRGMWSRLALRRSMLWEEVRRQSE